MINVLNCQFVKFTNLLENIIYSKSLKIFCLKWLVVINYEDFRKVLVKQFVCFLYLVYSLFFNEQFHPGSQNLVYSLLFY